MANHFFGDVQANTSGANCNGSARTRVLKIRTL